MNDRMKQFREYRYCKATVVCAILLKEFRWYVGKDLPSVTTSELCYVKLDIGCRIGSDDYFKF